MKETQDNSGLEQRAVDVFVQFLDADDRSDVRFEAICSEQPELAAALRRLKSNFEQLEGYLDPGSKLNVTQILEGTLDQNVDPLINISQGNYEMLERLSGSQARIGRYEAALEIGRGGMGAVMRAWDSELRRQVAMKVLIGSEGTGHGNSKLEPRRVRRFLEEVQITGQLDHPGVVPVHELGLDENGSLFFTMRLVRGRDLRKIFELAREEREGWNRARALSAVLRVCETMAFAHERGVIHRDLKPANVMVGSHGETYVMDWGLAKVVGEGAKPADSTFAEPIDSEESSEAERTAVLDLDEADDSSSGMPGGLGSEPEYVLHPKARSAGAGDSDSAALMTSEGTVLGTPTYMPPEQARGELSALGPHSDVYSVGAILYHLLAGHPPYLSQGESVTGSVVLERLLQGAPQSLDQSGADAPAELTAICERAMSREIADRYVDMGEMAEDLRAYIEGRVVRAYETGAIAEFRKWVRRNRGTAVAIAAGLLFTLGGLLFASFVQTKAKNTLADKNIELRQAEVKALGEALRAQQNEELALSNERAADAERRKVLRLADFERITELREVAGQFFPARPEMLPRMEAWLNSVQELEARLPMHLADLEELREGARKREAGDGLLAAPQSSELEEERFKLELARRMLAEKQGPDAPGAASANLVELNRVLEERVAALESEAAQWRPWVFDSKELQWQHNQLLKLTEDLQDLCDPESGLLREVRERVDFAGRVVEETVSSPLAARRWSEAIASIQNVSESPAYGGLQIAPQVGLMPLGKSEHSGLWEFALTETGEVPTLGMDGSFVLGKQTAVVFVLLPGGQFTGGSIAPSEQHPLGSPYVDSFGKSNEWPLYSVELDPFFLSKYELTQGQWLRMAGFNPSICFPDNPAPWVETYEWTNPVENISWEETVAVLARYAMCLPTEAQWEYAARGGTTTMYWSGDHPGSMQGASNLADWKWGNAPTAQPGMSFESWVDGWIGTAPVGSYFPNPFGFFDINGNVWELCQDLAHGHTFDLWPGTGESIGGNENFRNVRGGSFNEVASNLRSALRQEFAPDASSLDVGVRPAVKLQR